MLAGFSGLAGNFFDLGNAGQDTIASATVISHCPRKK